MALSVGFAARLVDMPWIKDGKPLDYEQYEQLARLLTAVFIVVSGWEWYNRDVRRRPLEKPWRFMVDVAVILSTIVFLFSSRNEGLWLISLVAIFSLYVLWDVLSIWDYPDDYDVTRPIHPGRVIIVYWRGFLNGTRRGPITNGLWLFLYFLTVPLLSWWRFWGHRHQTLISCLFLFLGAVLLRFDGNHKSRTHPPVFGWGTQYRVLAIVVLLVFYVVASIYLPRFV